MSGEGWPANNNNRRIVASILDNPPGDPASPNHQLSPLIFEIPTNDGHQYKFKAVAVEIVSVHSHAKADDLQMVT